MIINVGSSSRLVSLGAFALAAIVSLGIASPALGGTVNAGRGPVSVHVPGSYDPGSPAPLIVLLHGYSSNGTSVEDWMQFTPLSEEFGFLFVNPTGTSDFLGNPFWNATDACCDIFGGNPDDSTYLKALVDTIKATFSVDPRRVFFVGHSNGGFMSYRMACDHANTVAAIASLAGATFFNPLDCNPSQPVHTLQIHGTSDGVINYNGGSLTASYPGAIETTENWAQYNNCSLTPDFSPPPLDLDAGIAGAETLVRRYADSCDAGGSAELWTIQGGEHSPPLTANFSRGVVEFFLDHPKSAASGTVNGAAGGVADILLINGEGRRASVATNQAINISLDSSPSGPACANYALWVWPGTSFNETELAGGGTILGCTVNPTPLRPGLSPQPFRCLRSPALPVRICGSVQEVVGPTKTPWTLPLNGGIANPAAFVLQALVEDQGAANNGGFSVSNAVILEVGL